MRPFRAVLAALPLALLAPQALAQDAPGETAGILGDWAFEAEHLRPGCSLAGQITIRQGAEPDVYACSIVARDHCPSDEAWDFVAEQTCVATRKRDRLAIQSTLDRVQPDTNLYWPDNFLLTIIDGANMVGELRSGLINTDARLYRRTGPIS